MGYKKQISSGKLYQLHICLEYYYYKKLTWVSMSYFKLVYFSLCYSRQPPWFHFFLSLNISSSNTMKVLQCLVIAFVAHVMVSAQSLKDEAMMGQTVKMDNREDFVAEMRQMNYCSAGCMKYGHVKTCTDKFSSCKNFKDFCSNPRWASVCPNTCCRLWIVPWTSTLPCSIWTDMDSDMDWPNPYN